MSDICNCTSIGELLTNYDDSGIYEALSTKEDKVEVVNIVAGTASINAQVGKYYVMTCGTMVITLPTVTGTNVESLEIYMTTTDAPNVTFTSNGSVQYFEDFVILPNAAYEINALWNGNAWVLGMNEIETHI